MGSVWKRRPPEVNLVTCYILGLREARRKGNRKLEAGLEELSLGTLEVPVLNELPGTRRNPAMWFWLKVLVLTTARSLEQLLVFKVGRAWITCLFVFEDSCGLYGYSMSRH